jgi:sugar/nucleoside kinase (ribokinase family)
MSTKTQFIIKNPKPVCTGAGYVALDVVINGKGEALPHLWAGGSCGNVLTILSYMGWQPYPIANLGNDAAADRILEDMEKWGVKTDFIYKENSGSTPIVIERIKTTCSGKPSHKYEWKCPNCGSRLPKYRSIKVTSQIIEKMPVSQVFYFDRLSRSTLEIAKEQKSHGALIVFEPSRTRNKELFKEGLSVAHIVKYSHEQLNSSPIIEARNVLLEIQTLGAKGLRYRFNDLESRWNKWSTMGAFQITELVRQCHIKHQH